MAAGSGMTILETEPEPAEVARQASSRPIRVLHVITSLDRGGAENHLYSLVTRADRRRFQFEAAVLRADGELVEEFRRAGVAVHLLGARWRFDPWALSRLAGLLRSGRYDIVHSHL